MSLLMTNQLDFAFSRTLDENNKPRAYHVGVYCNLPDEEYFDIKALGSTDLVKLCKAPANWWWSSPYNPRRQLTTKRDLNVGKALHKFVLEGVTEYMNSVVESPFDSFMTKESKNWRAEQEESGRIILKPDDIYAVEYLGHLITNHPDTRGISKGLAEIAIIWTDESGIVYRAKLDSLLKGMTLDLKTYGGANAQGRSPFNTAMRLIAMRSYDVQRFQYHEARQKLREFVKAGLVFGATPEQMAMLEEVAEVDTWAWVWCFYQKLDCKEGYAPVVMPVGVMPGDISMRTGAMKVDLAIKNFKQFYNIYGLDNPWDQINNIFWAQDHDFLPWMGEVALPDEFINTDDESEA